MQLEGIILNLKVTPEIDSGQGTGWKDSKSVLWHKIIMIHAGNGIDHEVMPSILDRAQSF